MCWSCVDCLSIHGRNVWWIELVFRVFWGELDDADENPRWCVGLGLGGRQQRFVLKYHWGA